MINEVKPTKLSATQETYFLLGRLIAEQAATIDLIRRHIEEDARKWDHIYNKTDKLSSFVAYASGVAAVVGAFAAYVLHKIGM